MNWDAALREKDESTPQRTRKRAGRPSTVRATALLSEDGAVRFYHKGRLHRENDLPAVIYPDGRKVWYRFGKCIGAQTAPSRPDDFLPSANVQPERTVLRDGTVEYRLHGKLHRMDGPAWIQKGGAQKWFHAGRMHREDGPAWIVPRFFARFYKEGHKHRSDGPAIIFSQGTMFWFNNNKCMHPPVSAVVSGEACLRVIPMESVEEAEASAAYITGDPEEALQKAKELRAKATCAPAVPLSIDVACAEWTHDEPNFIRRN